MLRRPAPRHTTWVRGACAPRVEHVHSPDRDLGLYSNWVKTFEAPTLRYLPPSHCKLGGLHCNILLRLRSAAPRLLDTTMRTLLTVLFHGTAHGFGSVPSTNRMEGSFTLEDGKLLPYEAQVPIP